MCPALKAGTEIMYEINSYHIRYNILSHVHLSLKQRIFTHLKGNYDNEKQVYEEYLSICD